MPMQSGTGAVFWQWPNGYMWTGSGPRQYTAFIFYPQGPFPSGIPTVMAAISGLDSGCDHNLRVNVTVDLVNNLFFRVKVDTWADTQLAMVSIAWLAYT